MKLDAFKKHWNEDGDGVGPHGTGTRWGGDSVGRQSHRDTDTEMRPMRLRWLYQQNFSNIIDTEFCLTVFYSSILCLVETYCFCVLLQYLTRFSCALVGNVALQTGSEISLYTSMAYTPIIHKEKCLVVVIQITRVSGRVWNIVAGRKTALRYTEK